MTFSCRARIAEIASRALVGDRSLPHRQPHQRPESMTASEHLRRRRAAQGRAASKWLLEIIEDSKASGADNPRKVRIIADLSRNCCNFVTAIGIVFWL
jgi:hypothetical protein